MATALDNAAAIQELVSLAGKLDKHQIEYVNLQKTMIETARAIQSNSAYATTANNSQKAFVTAVSTFQVYTPTYLLRTSIPVVNSIPPLPSRV